MNHNLIITATGHFCNEFPRLRIELDSNVFYDGEVVNEQFVIPVTTNSVVKLVHHGKRFGQNRVWDTKVANGVIVADRNITVGVALDDINLKNAFHCFTFVQDPQCGEPVVDSCPWTGQLNFNGSVEIHINDTPLVWVTNLLYKKPVVNLSYFSNHSKLFHYEEELQLISEIESMLDV